MNKIRLYCSMLFALVLIMCLFAGCESRQQAVSRPAPPPPVSAPDGWIEDQTFDKIVYYATTRLDKCAPGADCPYGVERFDTGNAETAKVMQYGKATVKIPYRKKVGGLDGMELLPNIQDMSLEELRAILSPEDVLVFVHGFNTSFKESAIRCAQLSFDLNFPGEAAFFSWPSETRTEYREDKTRADESVKFLSDFLEKISDSNTDRKIHIIAHSMGTYVLSKAFADLDTRIKQDPSLLAKRRLNNGGKLFNQVILAAGDTSQDMFADMFKNNDFAGLAENYTLYSTFNDIPLRMSRVVNADIEGSSGPRIGDSHGSFFTLDGVDSVDARMEVMMQLFGHSYYANNSSLLTDIFLLLHYGTSPSERQLIQVIDKDQNQVWFIRQD